MAITFRVHFADGSSRDVDAPTAQSARDRCAGESCKVTKVKVLRAKRKGAAR